MRNQRTGSQLCSLRLFVGVSLLILTVLVITFVQRVEADSTTTTDPSAQLRPPAWLEPKGINVVDVVGLVPESHLRDIVIDYITGTGITVYKSGSRSGGQVTVNVAYLPENREEVHCLGKPAELDEHANVSPPGTMRIFDNGADVTHRVTELRYWPGELAQPIRPSNGTGATYNRYRELTINAQFDSTGALIVPANMGCTIELSGSKLTAQFKLDSQNLISVTHLNTVHADDVVSFIGEGAAGGIGPFRQQMYNKFGVQYWSRKVADDIPADADYFLVKFKWKNVEDFGHHHDQEAFGTYRTMSSDLGGGHRYVSVDHTNSMLLPVKGHWLDLDRSPGNRFLTYFDDFNRITTPEYFTPPGINFRSCMLTGNCPDSFLQQVYDVNYDMHIYFYKIERIGDGLVQVPLRAVGPSWNARTAEPTLNEPIVVNAVPEQQSEPVVIDRVQMPYSIFLPTLQTQVELPDDDPSAGCPCGWFDEYGRMLDFVAPR